MKKKQALTQAFLNRMARKVKSNEVDGHYVLKNSVKIVHHQVRTYKAADGTMVFDDPLTGVQRLADDGTWMKWITKQ